MSGDSSNGEITFSGDLFLFHNAILFIDTSLMIYTTKPFSNWKTMFGDNC